MTEVAAFSPFMFRPGTVIIGRTSPYALAPGRGSALDVNGRLQVNAIEL
jgi:hypothetical protein